MENIRQNALTLTTIQLTGAVSLPVVMAGYFVGVNYSMLTALLQIITVNIVLCIAACAYAQVAVQHRAITVVIAKQFFGKQGGLICGVGMLMILLGWSVIQFHYLIAAMLSLFAMSSFNARLIFSLVASASFYFTMVNGLRSFDKVNRYLLSLMLVVLVQSLMSFQGSAEVSVMNTLPVALGCIMILTTSAGMLYDLPTYYRHAATEQAMRRSLITLFIIVVPIMQILGLCLAKMQKLNGLTGFDLDTAFTLFSKAGLFFLIVSSFLSNCLNIYSAAMAATQFINYSYKTLLTVMCLICATSSFLSLSHSLLTLLEAINLLGAAMLSLILVYVFFKGANLSAVDEVQAKQHTMLLYAALLGSFLLSCLPFAATKDCLIDVVIISLLLMTIYCLMRKYLCAC